MPGDRLLPIMLPGHSPWLLTLWVGVAYSEGCLDGESCSTFILHDQEDELPYGFYEQF